MAKHVILEQYSFTPATRTIVITGKNIRREQLLLITNTSLGTVIYNFSDPSLGATSFVNAVNSVTGQETTTIVLAYATAAMSATDKLAILTEETYSEMIPAEVMRDPVDKLRVSTPQSLIDTDFEYGVQPTKWESINLLNNRPSAFYEVTAPITISGVSASGKTVTVNTTTPPAVGTPIFIQGTLDVGNCDGWWIVESNVSGSSFSFTTTNTPAATLYDATKTYLYAATFYTGSAIPAGAAAITLNGTIATATTTNEHGLRVGDAIYVVGTTGAAGPHQPKTTYTTRVGTSGAAFGTYTAVVQKSTSGTGTGATFNITTNAATTAYSTSVTALAYNAAGTGYKVGDTITVSGAGIGGVDVTNDLTFTVASITAVMNSSWVVATTPTVNTFTFACTATGTLVTPSNACIYARALGYVEHRAFDGGVQFSNVSPFHGYQVVRQTRRQFRYQSGKGIQFSTGSILKPALAVQTITSSGTTVTVTTKFPHGLSAGVNTRVVVWGAVETAYNGTFAVTTAATPTTFTYTALTTPSATTATGFPINVAPFSWYGASNRVGMFDQQNGIFFEFDGQQLYCVRRNSTSQLSGQIAVTAGSNSVVGTATKFSSQLKPGDYVVIRGMSYVVRSITSDTQMYIGPEYRGTTATNCIFSLTSEMRVPQSAWNIDKMDGTGASLYNLDLARMQMFYIDYTWYGAGAIRFGFKNNRGEIIYCHRMPNNNVNTEAYMRSGNLPARYETNTIPIRTYLTATLTSGITASMTVSDTTYFPSAGVLVVQAAGNTTSAIEYIAYTGKTATTFTGLTRNSTGGTGTATTHTYSATAPILVESYSPSQASTISHWGSSVIMDGRFDDDKSIQFNYGMNAPITYPTTSTRYPVFSIRLSPSVDSGLTGLLGAREIVNRMQLQPMGCGVYTTTAGVKVELLLNARVSGGTFAQVGGSSIAQYAAHTNAQTVSGGESIFTFFVPANSVSTQDLSKIRDIGNSILGGGNTLNYPTTDANKYPDGPDIITVVITPLASNASAAARFSWVEAQA